MQAPILPSRAALAERIALQFGYGQNLIHLVGRAGLGKSFLLEHLLTEHYPDFNKAFVQVTPNSDEKALMRSLLEHTFSQPLVDYTLGIEQNFHNIARDNQAVAALWVIDDAWHLSEEFLSDLSRLSVSAQGTLYILLASSRAQICANAVEIHLEPLNQDESLRLLNHYFSDLPLSEDPLFVEFIRQCEGNPALLLAWPEQRALIQAQQQPARKGWLLPVIAVSVVVLATLIYVLMSSNRAPQLILPQSKQATTAIATEKLAPSSAEVAPSRDSESTFSETSSEQPPEPQSEEEAPANDRAAIVKALSAENVEMPQPNSKAQLTAASTQELTEEDAQPEQAHSLYDHSWYADQQPQQWVYQLTVLKNVEQVEAFKARSNLPEAKHYYRPDKQWHVVTWSQAVDKSQLGEQKAKIKEQLPTLDPYAKPIAQIIKEIHSQPSP